MHGIHEHVQVAMPIDRRALLRGEVLELGRACGEFIAADDERRRKALLGRDLELLPHPLCLGKKLHSHAGRTEGRRDPQVVGEMCLVEEHEKHLGRRLHCRELAEFVEAGEQAVDAERRPDSGQRLLRVQPGEIVVAAARADAPERGQVVEEAFEHDACVVVEAAGDRRIDDDTALGDARRLHAVEDCPERSHAHPPALGIGDEALEPGEHVGHRARQLRHLQELLDRIGRHAVADQLGFHGVTRRLAQLVERPQHVGRPVGEAE